MPTTIATEDALEAAARAAANSDVDGVRRHADDAGPDPQRVFSAHMLLGCAMLSAGRAMEAREVYRELGAAATSNGAAVLERRLQAHLGEATALVTATRYDDAAAVYEPIAALASQLGNSLLASESWRMAAWCHAQSGARETAWRCGHAALDAAAPLDLDSRRSSSLGLAGQQLLALLTPHDHNFRRLVHDRMHTLLGAMWDDLAADHQETHS